MSTDASSSLERLNKFIAFHLGISRREADDMIARGDIRINNTPAILGARINTKKDSVTVGDTLLSQRKHYSYVALHKPSGYVCSRREQGETPTIYSLLPPELHHLKPVGRLDKDSSGLILLSDDGDFAYQMTHPKFYKQKIYEVELDTELAPLHQQMINEYGVQLDDGPSKLTLERISDKDRYSWRIIMSEGRNRQIRRTFAALGYNVIKLHRTQFGNYALGDIQPGRHTSVDISSNA